MSSEGHLAAELISARESELRHAMLAGDVVALDRLIDDSLVFTMPTGVVVDKAADLEAHRTGRLRLTMMEPADQRVAHYGIAAVVSVQMELTGTYDEVPFGGTFRYTRVWIDRPDGWRVVAGPRESRGRVGPPSRAAGECRRKK